MKHFILITLFALSLFVNSIHAQLKLPYTFENRSRYADEEIYIGLVGKTNELGDVWMDMSSSELKIMSASDNTIPGPEWSFPQDWLYPDIFTKLSEVENNTIQIPHGLYGCRIFISFESPMYLRFHETGGYAGANLSNPGDPNTGIRWEIVELTWGNIGLWTNTSRVDAYQYPMGLEVNGFFGGINPSLTYEELYNAGINGAGTPQFKKIGEVLSHQEILEAWDNTVSAPYLVAKIIKEQSIDGEPIIEQPSKVHDFPDTILDTYIDDIWETFKNHDLVLNIGDRGIWKGRVDENDVLSFTDPIDGSVASIYGKPSTIDALEGAGFLASSNSTNPEVILEDLMIQAQISAAITRHAIYTNIIDGSVQDTHNPDRFFQIAPYNEYVSFFHSEAISFESQTYAFAYDDVGDHSSTIQSTFPTDVKVIIGGYGTDNTSAELTTIEITSKSSTILENENLQLTAQGFDQYGKNFNTNISWSATGGTISSNGLFSATQSGNYTITASSGNITTSTEVIVSSAPAILTSIDITPKDASIITNEALQLTAQGIDQYGNEVTASIIWSTNGGSIGNDGLFSSYEKGIYTVTATAGNVSSSTQVSVSETPPILTSIEISPETTSILTNESLSLTAQGKDQYGENIATNLIWSIISGEATIASNGTFNTSIAGDYIIRASQENIYEDITIKVTAAETNETCSGIAQNGDFNYVLSTESNNSTISFSSLNNTTITECNLHYSVNSSKDFSTHSVSTNEAFPLNINDGNTVYFYYTYTLNLEENKTSNTYSFQTGNCMETIGLFDNGEDNLLITNSYAIYPNPSNGKQIHITGLTENVTINFFNLEGKLIRTDQTTNVDHIIIKPSELTYGFYIVTITSNESKFRKNFKLIVN